MVDLICGRPAKPRGAWQPGGGGVVLGLSFAGYVPLACQSPCSIIVYSVASYRPSLKYHNSLPSYIENPNREVYVLLGPYPAERPPEIFQGGPQKPVSIINPETVPAGNNL